MRKRDYIIIWPQYFDKTRSERLGRRVGINIGTNNPTANDVLKAALKLGYQAELNPTPKFPATWWDDPGQVTLEGKGQKKTHILRKLAIEVQTQVRTRNDEAKLDEVRKKYKKKQNLDMLKKKIIEKTSNK